MAALTPEKALIFRITHVSNLGWILANGLHCCNGAISDPGYIQIGNSELIIKRAVRAVPIAPGGTLNDYIPFYFTPYSPMLLNIKTGYNGVTKRSMDEIAILVSSLPKVQQLGVSFVFTDRHAYLQTAQFHNQLGRLDSIDWKIIRTRDFKRDPENPGKLERYQAEALIHRRLPVEALLGIVCYNNNRRGEIQANCDNLNLQTQVMSKPDWYL